MKWGLWFGLLAVSSSLGACGDSAVTNDEDISTSEASLVKGTTGAKVGDSDYCGTTSTAKCGLGEGDCDSNAECQTGLVCVAGNLAKRGTLTGDACAPVTCGDGIKNIGETSIDCGGPCGNDCTVTCDKPNGNASRCSTDCPCSVGEGDCDSTPECQPGLVCGTGNGTAFGLPAGTDVCWGSTCQNGAKDGNETAVDCGGSCAPCAPPAAGMVAFASSGTALLHIVIAPHADPNVHAAVVATANDLRDKLNAIVRTTTFVVDTPTNTPSGISLGIDGDFPNSGWPYQGYFRPNDVLAGGVLRPDRLALQEQYVLRTPQGSNRVIVAGATTTALQDAVWDLLAQAGYRHFFATPTWEVIPFKPSLTLQLSTDEKPAFLLRNLTLPGNTWESAFVTQSNNYFADWTKHNRLGGSVGLGANTGYGAVVTYWQNLHGTTFPAELSTDPSKNQNGRQFCLTGSKTIAGTTWTVESVVREWALAQTSQSLSLSPNVNISWASAPAGSGLNCNDINDPTYSNIANRMAAILNAAAAAQPTKPVTATLRQEFTDPPTLALKQNVFVSVAQSYPAATTFALENRLKNWSDPAFEVGVSDYFDVSNDETPGQAQLSLQGMLDRATRFYKLGARRYTADINWGWGMSGPAWWTLAQVLWDADAPKNAQTYRDDFLTNAFGAAAAPLDNYFKVLEGHAQWSENLVGQMYRALNQGFNATNSDADVQTRLGDLAAYTRYLELNRKFWNRCSSPNGAGEEAELKQLLQFAYATRDRRIFESRDAMLETSNAVAVCSNCMTNGCSATGAACVMSGWAVDCLTPSPPAGCDPNASLDLKSGTKPTLSDLKTTIVPNGVTNTHVLPSGAAHSYTNDLVPFTSDVPETNALPARSGDIYSAKPFYLYAQRPSASGALGVHVRKFAAGEILAGRVALATSPGVSLGDRVFAGTDMETDWSFDISSALHRVDLDDRGGRMYTSFPTSTRVVIPVGPNDPPWPFNYRWSGYFVVPAGTTSVIGWSQTDGNVFRFSKATSTWQTTRYMSDFAVGSACTSPRIIGDSSRSGALNEHFVIPVSPAATKDELWAFDDGNAGTLGDRVLLSVPPYLFRSPGEGLVPHEVAPETVTPVSCSTSSTCRTGQYCSQGGTCRSDGGGCTVTSQCAAGQSCQGGTCQCTTCSSTCTCGTGGACQTNTDCRAGFSCVEHTCQDATNGGGPGAPCTSDDGCLTGLSCASQQCVPSCQVYPNTPACIAARCADGIKNGDETDVDCGGSCSACNFASGHQCSGTASCKSGLMCASGAGPRFGLARGVDVCINESCLLNPLSLGCGHEGDLCGTNCENVVPCTPGIDSCGAGQACLAELPVPTVHPYPGVCAPTICTTDAASHCGTPESECGECTCSPDCDGKQCGADDGCGGTCRHLCAVGETCSDDSACGAGLVCGRGIGSRFGLAAGTNACWPKKCADGLVSPDCPGNQPVACEGEFCGDCPAGSYRANGTCTASVLSLKPDGSNFPDPIQPTPTDQIGATKGTFDVSARGTAEYTVPIQVPPGRLGLQPEIALAYSSTKRDGLVGVGWNLTGLPSISRCRRIVDRDGSASPVTFDNRDRFCLDNQALIQVAHNPPETYGAAGAEYRTEIDSFTRIIAFGGSDDPLTYSGPLYFKAWTKDGRILTFGRSTDSSVLVDARIKRVWSVSAMEDRVGNRISIQYESHKTVGTGRYGWHTSDVVEDTGELLPKVIGYGGRTVTDEQEPAPGNISSRFVRFDYEERPDALHHYVSGVQGYSNHRLTGIRTFVEDSVVNSYKLTYGAGSLQLTRIEECAPDAATGGEACKGDTVFDYYSHRQPTREAITRPLNTNLESATFDPVTIDVNGDGLDEVLVGGGDTTFRWRLASLNFDGADPVPQSVQGSLDLPGPLGTYVYESPCLSKESVVDLDHDGQDDLVYLCAGSYGTPSNSLNWYKYSNQAFQHQPSITIPDFSGIGRFADLNGDGLKDLVWCDNNQPPGYGHSPRTATVRFTLNNSLQGLYSLTFGPTQVAGVVGACKDLETFDVDGDGDDDILHPATGGAVVVYSMAAQAFVPVAPGGFGFSDARLVDFNGDGLRDIAVSGPSFAGAPRELKILVNTGRTFEEQLFALPGNDLVNVRDAIVADIDGNGSEDLVTGDAWIASSGPGEAIAHPMATFKKPSQDQVWTYMRGAFADLDGDGEPEYVFDGGRSYLESLHSGRSKLLQRVTDGFGKRFEVSYNGWETYADRSSLAPSRHRTYPLNYSCQQPSSDFTCARRVAPVASYSREINVIQTDSEQHLERLGAERYYKYGNFRIGLRGRGSFGFESREIALGSLSTTEEQYLNTDYRTAGHLGSTSTIFGNGVADGGFGTTASSCVLSQLAWNVRAGAALGTSFAFVSSQDDFEGHPAQSLCNWVTHRSSTIAAGDVDDFGSVTKKTDVLETRTPDGYRSVTKIYSTPRENRVDEWIIGLLDSATLSETRGGETLVRTTNYAYDGHGLLQLVEREPGHADSPLYQRISIERSAAFGVTTRSCVQDRDGVETERCTEALNFDEYKIFPTSVRNAGGLVTYLDFAARDGQLLVAKDPNHLVSEFSYDAFGRQQGVRTPTGNSEFRYQRAFYSPTEFDDVSVYGAMAIVEDRAGGGTTTTTYDADGRVVATKAAGFDTDVYVQREYDQLGRLNFETLPHEAEDSSQGRNHYTYDALSRLEGVIGPTGLETRFTQVDYSMVDASHASWFSGTDGAWAMVEQKPRGNVHVTIRDLFGAIARTIDAGDSAGSDEKIVNFKHGALGYLKEVSTPDSVITFGPDLLGRNGEIDDPALGNRTYRYNGFDEVVGTTDAKDVALSFTYDGLGRPLETLDASGNPLSSRIYDGDGPNELGKLVATTRQAVPGSATVNATFLHYDSEAGLISDVEHRVEASSAAPDTTGTLYRVGYGYGAGGFPWRLGRIDYPDNGGSFSVELGYTETGYLETVHKPSNPTDYYWRATASDQGIRLTEEQFGNGAVSTHRYYSLENQSQNCAQAGEESCLPGSVQSIKTESSAGVVQDITYGYDSNGNVTSIAPVGASIAFQYMYEYDGLDRMTEQHLFNASGEHMTDYVYHSGGALAYKSDVGTYSYDDHRLEAGANTYKFDANGNQWERSGPQVSSGYQKVDYNEQDMPYRVTSGSASGAVTSFEYEASDQRVVTRETVAGGHRLTHSIDELYDRVSSPGTPTSNRYRIYAGDRAIAEVMRPDAGTQRVAYLHTDRLGSPTTVTGSAGEVLSTQRFDPFGNPINSPDQSIRADFTGHTADFSLELINMRGRMFDPKLGQFLSADPFVTDPTSSQGWHRYSYVENNPLGATDPSGFEMGAPQVEKPPPQIGQIFNVAPQQVHQPANATPSSSGHNAGTAPVTSPQVSEPSRGPIGAMKGADSATAAGDASKAAGPITTYDPGGGPPKEDTGGHAPSVYDGPSAFVVGILQGFMPGGVELDHAYGRDLRPGVELAQAGGQLVGAVLGMVVGTIGTFSGGALALATSPTGVGAVAGGAVAAGSLVLTAAAVANASAALGAIVKAVGNGGGGEGGAKSEPGKPTFQPNPVHTPGQPGFHSDKTIEPADSASVYETATKGVDGKWYGQGGNGQIYRFASDNAGGAHFNGMTGGPNGVALKDIPIAIRRAFGMVR